MSAKITGMLLLALLASGQACATPQTCEVILCQGGCFEGKYRNGQLDDVECDKSAPEPGYTIRTFAAAMAPDPVVIECEPLGYGDYLCEVFPTGNFTYSWSTSGSVNLPYPGTPYDSAQYVSCNGPGSGVLSVTVTSETWSVGARNRYFNCGGGY